MIDEVVYLSDADLAYLNSLHITDYPKALAQAKPNKSIMEIIEQDDGYRYAVARDYISPGMLLVENSGSLIDRPLKYSIQVAPNLHRVGLGAIEHSCTPNSYVDVHNDFSVRARENIFPGAVITINYLFTEQNLSVPFHCNGTYDTVPHLCYGLIGGYTRLGAEHRIRLHSEGEIAPHFLEDKLKTA